MNKVIFLGTFSEGTSPSIAREKFKAQFKISDEQADKIFSGKSVVLKSTPNTAEAEKLHLWATKLGMNCQISLSEEDLGITLDTIENWPINPITSVEENFDSPAHPISNGAQNNITILLKLLLQFPVIKGFSIALIAVALIQLAIGPLRSDFAVISFTLINIVLILIMVFVSFSVIVNAMYKET